MDGEGGLVGLITFKDINKRREFPNACKDTQGRLRVGAAIGASARGTWTVPGRSSTPASTCW
jgi:IMP dehydrogenase